MKVFGWTLFSISLLVFIWKGLSLFVMFAKGIRYSLPTQIIGTIFLVCISIILAGVGWKLSHQKPKPKYLVCPNGCNITQAGSKFCGQCGTRLVQQ
jgi:hypothetical protein